MTLHSDTCRLKSLIRLLVIFFPPKSCVFFYGTIFHSQGDFSKGGKGDKVANGGKTPVSKEPQSSEPKIGQGCACLHYLLCDFCKSYITSLYLYVDYHCNLAS